EPLVEGGRVSLVVEADDRLPRITTDPDKVRHILLNLVSNAIKYTDDGSITVLAEAVDGRMLVEVADTGVGIPRSELARISTEFHRADASGARRLGTGLGLTIS